MKSTKANARYNPRNPNNGIIPPSRNGPMPTPKSQQMRKVDVASPILCFGDTLMAMV